MMTVGKKACAVTAMVLMAPVAMAEVTGTGVSGFEVREKVHIAAAPNAVYAAVLTPKRWWDSKHTYPGDAARTSD